MAYIIGPVTDKEIQRIKSAGYFIEEYLTEEREKQICKYSRKEINGEIPEEQFVMVHIAQDVVDLLNLDKLS